MDGYLLVAWHDLECGYRSLKDGEALYPGAPARALGYIAEGLEHLKAGQSIRQFILLPDSERSGDSGQPFGDRMIEGRLQEGTEIRLASGALVWVCGVKCIEAVAQQSKRLSPAVCPDDAAVESASTTDITKYFHQRPG